MPKKIFVFGSNLAGRHGKGAALHAKQKFGAIYGQGVGLQGQSYAIPTKDEKIKTLPLEHISVYVKQFLEFANENPALKFYVSPIGCGLAGYTPEQIAPMFVAAGHNVELNRAFQEALGIYRDIDLFS